MSNTQDNRLKLCAGLTLVELVVAMSILAVLSTMLVMVWTNLQRSYASTISSTRARETARDAMARMRREIRDMQLQPVTPYLPVTLQGEPCILKAIPDEIWFTTPYSDLPGSTFAGSILLTRYWYDATGADGGTARCLYRQRDVNNNGVFDSGDPQILVARNIVNALVPSTDPTSSSTPLFRYTYYTAGGLRASAPAVPTDGDRSRIMLIKVQILVDLNPGKTPNYMDLESTVQPRNLRQI